MGILFDGDTKVYKVFDTWQLLPDCITWMSIGVNDAKGDSYSEH